MHKEYSGLSALFTQVEGITIEQYFLLQRLERVKELIKYGEMTMSEIADRTGFSGVAHLSAQFKKLTGMTPTAFKELGSGRTRSTTWKVI
ncbi:MAG: helix-turn-helix transcriptional regulator [Flavobacteriales bacterium]|nr:helix-turn-helix transcriptional regulator [Flavobacteriales bacterium]